MKGLIIKETALFRKSGYFWSILIFMALSVLFSVGDGTFYLFYTPFVGVLYGTCICDSFKQDKLSGWQDYAEAFPYGKSKIILSKYIAGIINIVLTGIIIALSFIARGISAGFGIGEAVPDGSIYGAICALAMLIIGNGIVIFIYFKRGDRMVSNARLIQIGAMAAISYMFCSSQSISFTPIHSVIFMTVAMAAYGVSWKTSERISEKRI